ncbi:MAG: fibrinogen-like YCDxxxxGGGW domain-containing protein, partial [Myxococcota bacterium]|nr:fibrinogen-like YCDxxxxGGGW domain-containing protein [Myxococcota bacterium]
DDNDHFKPDKWENCDGTDGNCDGGYYDMGQNNSASCDAGTFCAAGLGSLQVNNGCLDVTQCQTLHFDGTETGWYRVPSHALLRPERLTLAAWIRPETPPPGRDVQGIIDHDAMYGLALVSDGRLEARVRMPIEGQDCSDDQPWLTATSLPGTIPVDTWSWVAAIYDGHNLRLFRDGILVGSAHINSVDEVGLQPCASSGLDLGRRGTGQGFVGQLRQVTVIGRALDGGSPGWTWLRRLGGSGEVEAATVGEIRGHWPMTGQALTGDRLVDHAPGQLHALPVTTDYEASAFFAESCQLLGPSSIGGDLVHCGEAMSWWDSREACIGLGGDLASTHSDTDDTLITAAGGGWIGFNDLAEEGSFGWSDGTEVGGASWDDHEPNDGGDGEDCTVVLAGGLWNDAPCPQLREFTCRIPPTGVGPEWTSRDDCAVVPVLGLEEGQSCAQAADPALCTDHDQDGWYPMAGDCDDTKPEVHAAAPEQCDTLDNDCDGIVDNVGICCGDSVVDPGESCDDGNVVGDDACSADCSRIGYPLAYYDMEEGTGGAIANKSLRYQGQFGGALSPQPPDGPQFVQDGNPANGHHLQFDGSSQVDSFPGWAPDGVDLWLTAPRFSIAAWVHPDTLPVADGDVSNQATIITVGDAGRLTASHRTGEGWDFTLQDVDTFDEGDEVNVTTAIDHPSYATGQWTHLVGTYDGDWLRLYVDGDEAAKEQVGDVPRLYFGGTGANTRIASSVAANRNFNGAIDEVSLWDEALGPDEVKALYNDGAPASANALAVDGFCGDGIVQPGEACDDANEVKLDGCESTCNRSLLGDHCDTPITIPRGAFAPSGVICDQGPCIHATVSGDTATATDYYEATCGADSGAPELVYTFDLQEPRYGIALSTDEHLIAHTGPVGGACMPWTASGTPACFDAAGDQVQGLQFPAGPGLYQVTVDGALGAESAGPFELTVTLYTCGDGAVDHDAGEACDDGNLDDQDGCNGKCALEADALPVDCADILYMAPGTKSGLYDIYPGGGEAALPVTVWCDMAVDGGGWTRIFIADSDNLDGVPHDYTVTAEALRSSAFEAMIAYMPAGGGLLTAPTRFAMPQDWVDQSPMTYEGKGATVTVTVGDDAPIVGGTLKYGGDGFLDTCSASWSASAWGRICVQGTTAPFYSGFNHNDDDMCSLSDQLYTETDCSAERRFAIFTRRPICGNGIDELGEGCDDLNAIETDGCISTCESYDPMASEDCAAILAQAPNAPEAIYTIYPDGVTETVQYCGMTPGEGCAHPIDISREDFVPGNCNAYKCRVKAITRDHMESTDGWVVPGCSEAS